MHDASAQKVAREALRLLNWPTKKQKNTKRKGEETGGNKQ